MAFALPGSSPAKDAADTRVFEMRTYYAPPGKLDDLHARFRDHTMGLFKKHGIENIGYFVPIDNTNNTLIYLLAYPSREARETSWKAFGADPDWKAAAKASEANGKLVAKVDQIFLQSTDFSPAIKTGDFSKGGVFEMRTYTTPAGKLPNLDSRFRDHTVDLFKKHGMKNWVYFHKMPDQKEADTTLVYFLAHKSQDAAKASFDAFRKDPAWTAAKEASEAAGALTVKDGVNSVFLAPTDYSPTK
ncbi:MAG: NIPSNAP family protein [Verrucomicrobiota bacterium]